MEKILIFVSILVLLIIFAAIVQYNIQGKFLNAVLDFFKKYFGAIRYSSATTDPPCNTFLDGSGYASCRSDCCVAGRIGSLGRYQCKPNEYCCRTVNCPQITSTPTTTRTTTTRQTTTTTRTTTTRQTTTTRTTTTRQTTTTRTTTTRQTTTTFLEKILNVPLDRQNYKLSCELSSAAMIASYYKKGSTDYWEEKFVREIPKHCNPHRGFRGEINGYVSTYCNPPPGYNNPVGYGVYNEPIAELLTNNGIPSIAVSANYDMLEDAIMQGKPVIVWLSRRTNPVETETDPETGQTFKLIYGEHAVVVTGVTYRYGQRAFIVNDPISGVYTLFNIPRWEDFDNMAVIPTSIAPT
ncbi:MAG: C39 family peptidase [Candidatus Aenigmatarchaeota archaeon]